MHTHQKKMLEGQLAILAIGAKSLLGLEKEFWCI